MSETFESGSLRTGDCDAHLSATNEPDLSGTGDRGQTEAALGPRSGRLSHRRFARRVGLLILVMMAVLAAACGSSDDGMASPGQVSSSSDGTPVVVAADGFSCAIGADRSIECWGDVYAGSNVPAGEFSALTLGGWGPCAIRTDGTLACWAPDWAQDSTRHMPPSGEFMAVASGDIHSCALRTDGSPACWGDTRGGEGLPQGEYTAIVAAGERTCGMLPDSTVVCQGSQGFVTSMPGEFTSFDIDGRNLCGIRTDETISCFTIWNVEPSGFSPPAGEFSAVSLGGSAGYGCAIRAGERSVECWIAEEYGNDHGEAIPPAGEFISISTGSRHACGVRTDKAIVCWGDNELGQAAPPQTLSG